jgi:hypothetical protein
MIGVRFPAGAGNFSHRYRVQTDSGAHPVSYPMGTRGSFPGVKRLEREADHSPQSSAEVKECVELYPHSPKYVSIAWCLVKHSDNLPLPFFEKCLK